MIVILTGAGVSQESGLATFRASDGLWENERVEDVATPRGFAKNPDKVFRFYNERRRKLAEVRPNAAHFAIAQLEREADEEVLLITQNVDDLHERAGSQNLLHMHGELLKGRCTNCGKVHHWADDMGKDSECPSCGKTGHVRPHIVWFEEMPLHMERIEDALANCRLFAAIGTSGNVYPAAGFVSHARFHGATVVEFNLEPSAVHRAFHDGRYGNATDVVPEWVDEVLGKS